MHLLDTSAVVRSATGNLSDYKRRMGRAIRIIVMGAKRGRDMKIAVVGATGVTGRRVVKHALGQGNFVTAVARHPEGLSPADQLSFARGDVLSRGDLTDALEGVEAVISCIGPEKNLSPGTLMSVGVASILTECKRANVRRFILQSGIGLSDGRELSCPWLVNLAAR